MFNIKVSMSRGATVIWHVRGKCKAKKTQSEGNTMGTTDRICVHAIRLGEMILSRVDD